jgi:hypothetical protein
VVGHRNLPEPLPELRRVVRGLLTSFSQKYPSTRMVLLSSLAEGADRLVASEALALGFSLVVPLPMPLEEYENDFATAQSLAEFRSLLARAESWFVVPSPEAHAPTRAEAYANCGAYIARRCVELIALWDGRPSPTGGTAQVVAFHLNGVPPPYVPERSLFDPSLCGPVHHVMTPRGATEVGGSSFGVTVDYPRSAVVEPASAFERAECEIERFNRDVVSGPFAERARGLSVRRQAETLANGYQRRTTASQLAISASAFLAIIAFNLYSTFSSHSLELLVAYVLFSAAAFALYLAFKRGEWQLRYQDYRALEQVLRTGEHWRAAGIERSVASQFAKGEHTKIDWIAIALRALTEPFEADAEPVAQISAEQLQAVYEGWILEQQRYFAHLAGKRERTRERVSSRIVTLCVAFSVALTIGSHFGSSVSILKGSIGIALFAATVLAVVAALIHDFAEKRGWTEHSRHYELMAALFGYAADRVAPLLAHEQTDAIATRQIHAILIALGDEAIRENLAWLNLHRSRPLNVPHV